MPRNKSPTTRGRKNDGPATNGRRIGFLHRTLELGIFGKDIKAFFFEDGLHYSIKKEHAHKCYSSKQVHDRTIARMLPSFIDDPVFKGFSTDSSGEDFRLTIFLAPEIWSSKRAKDLRARQDVPATQIEIRDFLATLFKAFHPIAPVERELLVPSMRSQVGYDVPRLEAETKYWANEWGFAAQRIVDEYQKKPQTGKKPLPGEGSFILEQPNEPIKCRRAKAPVKPAVPEPVAVSKLHVAVPPPPSPVPLLDDVILFVADPTVAFDGCEDMFLVPELPGEPLASEQTLSDLPGSDGALVEQTTFVPVLDTVFLHLLSDAKFDGFEGTFLPELPSSDGGPSGQITPVEDDHEEDHEEVANSFLD